MIKENNKLDENTTNLLYRLINSLLYFADEERLRLYISTSVEKEVFQLIYNELDYLGYTRTYKRLINRIYILNIVKKLYKFIRHYSYY